MSKKKMTPNIAPRRLRSSLESPPRKADVDDFDTVDVGLFIG